MKAVKFPGPKGHWFYGNLKTLRRDNVRFFLRLYHDYGEHVAFRLGPAPMLLVANHETAYRILVKEANKFIKGERFWRDLDPLIGQSILRIDGDAWKRKRKLYAPSFHPNAIAHYSQIMTRFSKEFAARMIDGEKRDIHADMVHLTADIVCQCLFDRLPSDDGVDLVHHMDQAAEATQVRRTQLLKLPLWMPTANNRVIRNSVAALEDIVLKYLDQEIAAESQGKTLLSLLVHSRDENGGSLSRKELRDETMTLFLAGHETTALSASWAWYELTRRPTIYQRMCDEIDTVLQGRDFTFHDVSRLPFTHAVLNESLRLYPPAPTIPRQLDDDFDLHGIKLKKGINLIVSPYVIHRNPKFFPEPEVFRPERWLDDLEKQLPKCQFMPFGSGPRVCIGNTFALLEGMSILVGLSQQVTFSQTEPYTRQAQQHVTLRPLGDLPVVVHRRDANQALAQIAAN